MSDEHLVGHLQALLESPPLPVDSTDSTQFAATVIQSVRHRRRRRHLMTGGLAAVAVAAGIITPIELASTGSRPTVTVSPDTRLPESAIVNAIMNEALFSKDPTPTSIQYVYGKRDELKALVSGHASKGVDGQAPSVLVEAIGKFSMPSITAPVIEPSPTGAVLWLIINQKTGEQTDYGINQRPDNLASIGKVFHPLVPKNVHPAKKPGR